MKIPNRSARVVAAALTLALGGRAAGDLRVGASAGVGSAYGQTYYEIGGRLGYDVAFGLTPEIGVSYWAGGSPSFVQLTPGLTWYFPVPIVRPYLGGFYVHDFVSSGLPDQDGFGLRGGIALFGTGPLSVSLGVAWERRLSCSVQCDTWWPEAVAGVSF